MILGNQEVVSSRVRLQVSLGDGDDTINGKRLFIGGDQLIYGGAGDDDTLTVDTNFFDATHVVFAYFSPYDAADPS